MGIIDKLKDYLGIGGGTSARRAPDSTDVPAEREADAASERAVKGVDDGGDPSGATVEEDEGDASASDDGAPAEPAADDGEPVDAIKGIGASYAERLGEAGVHTVADLAAADPDDLAERTGLGAGRVGNWIERAQVRER